MLEVSEVTEFSRIWRPSLSRPRYSRHTAILFLITFSCFPDDRFRAVWNLSRAGSNCP